MVSYPTCCGYCRLLRVWRAYAYAHIYADTPVAHFNPHCNAPPRPHGSAFPESLPHRNPNSDVCACVYCYSHSYCEPYKHPNPYTYAYVHSFPLFYAQSHLHSDAYARAHGYAHA